MVDTMHGSEATGTAALCSHVLQQLHSVLLRVVLLLGARHSAAGRRRAALHSISGREPRQAPALAQGSAVQAQSAGVHIARERVVVGGGWVRLAMGCGRTAPTVLCSSPDTPTPSRQARPTLPGNLL